MEKKQQSRKKEEIIICLVYDSNEYSYINSSWGPIELHRIFLTKALKTLEQNDGCFVYINSAEENTFICENVSDDFALYDRMQKDMFKSMTKKFLNLIYFMYLSNTYTVLILGQLLF